MGACRDFDGINDDINFGTDPTFVGDSEFTFMSWINANDLTSVQIFNGKWTPTQKPFFYGIISSKLSMSIGDGDNTTLRSTLSTAILSTLISTGEWRNISGTNSLTTLIGNKQFIDGSEIASTVSSNTTETSIQSNSTPYTCGDLGGGAPVGPYDGKLCYCAVYDSRLSESAIAEVQYNPFSFIAKSLIPLWDSGATEIEIGNGLTGTVTGALENFDGPPVFLLGGQ